MSLLEVLLLDIQSQQSDGAHPERDMETCRARVKNEGLSFLTITLPAFGKDFEQALERGFICSTDFRSFRKSGSIPAFLQGMMQHVFDKSSGELLECPRIDSIYGIRQVAYAFKKIEAPCSSKRVADAYSAYIECDRQIPTEPESLDSARLARFRLVSRYVWPLVLEETARQIQEFRLEPKHGPGATAERLSPNGKWTFPRWHERLESFLPFTEYAIANLNEVEDDLASTEFVSPEHEEPVRVISVPKTMKGPRVIAIEPSCMMYAQQAMLTSLTDSIERHTLTAGVFNFRDQSVNQRLALRSSRDKKFATLDLSEASDRVSFMLVRYMLESCPDVWNALESCRTRHASVPGRNGNITLPLRKFASMGSGVCFPIEAMVFYTILLCCELDSQSSSDITWDSIKRASGKIKVFGDDIIVPTGNAPAAIDWLESFGLKVNLSKTFWNGKFRESCGVDAYDGTDITVVYLRSFAPDSRRSSDAVISWVNTANQLYARGLWRTCEFMRQKIEKLYRLPYGPQTAGYLCWHSYIYKCSHARWDPALHSWRTRSPYNRVARHSDPLSGRPALHKCLHVLRRRGPFGEFSEHRSPWGNIQEPDSDHLASSVRRGGATLQSRWHQVQ